MRYPIRSGWDEREDSATGATYEQEATGSGAGQLALPNGWGQQDGVSAGNAERMICGITHAEFG